MISLGARKRTRAAAAVILAGILAGCGETSSDGGQNGSDAGSGGSGAGACTPSGVPPVTSHLPEKGSTFALRAIDFGPPRPLGSGSSWLSVGFDLDCCAGTGCNGTCPTTIPDDIVGIDNSFGGELLPVLDQSEVHIASSLQNGMEAGAWALLIRIAEGGNAQIDWATSGSSPKFDGTDTWVPEIGTSLAGTAYLADAQLVVRAPRIDLPYRTDYKWPKISILDAVLTISADGSDAQYAGVLAGVLAPEPLAFEFYEALAAGDPQKCPAFLDRFADPYVDSKRSGSEKKCTHVSIGARVSLTAASSAAPKPGPPWSGTVCQ